MKRDPAIPEAQLRFEPVRDAYGNRLALVFGNEAPAGVCPYYGRQCYHCDIGAGEGVQFNTEMNLQRLAFFRQHYAEVLPKTSHLVFYNSGSVLNPRELSPPSLKALLNYAAELPECRVVSLDSREAFITSEHLDFVLGLLRADQQPRPILGLETQDDTTRLTGLNKKILRRNVEAVFHTVGKYGGRVGLDINIVFALPPFQGAAAAAEAEATARYVLDLAQSHAVPVDFNFHPYYPSRIGRERFPDHPRADLHEAFATAQSIRAVISQRGQNAHVFIGWQDEEHDQEPALRSVELSGFREAFARFNTSLVGKV